jgi:hypothetical protein
LTVTVNVQGVELPLVSVAVQLTVVTPFGNVEPLAGVQTGVTVSQLSVALKPVNVTAALQTPGSVLTVRFVQPAKTGA